MNCIPPSDCVNGHGKSALLPEAQPTSYTEVDGPAVTMDGASWAGFTSGKTMSTVSVAVALGSLVLAVLDAALVALPGDADADGAAASSLKPAVMVTSRKLIWSGSISVSAINGIPSNSPP